MGDWPHTFLRFSGGVAAVCLEVSEKRLPSSSSESSNNPPPDAERGFRWEGVGGESGEERGGEGEGKGRERRGGQGRKAREGGREGRGEEEGRRERVNNKF